jgi:hypothetical protein
MTTTTLTVEQLALMIVEAATFDQIQSIVQGLVSVHGTNPDVVMALKLLDDAHAEAFGSGLLFAINDPLLVIDVNRLSGS